jgi:hypothetical protein
MGAFSQDLFAMLLVGYAVAIINMLGPNYYATATEMHKMMRRSPCSSSTAL